MLRPSNPTPTSSGLTRQTSISDLITTGQANPFERVYDSNGLLRQPSLSDLMDFDIDTLDLQRDSIQTPSNVATTTQATEASRTTTRTTTTASRGDRSSFRSRNARMQRQGIVTGTSLQPRQPTRPQPIRPTQPVFSSESSISNMNMNASITDINHINTNSSTITSNTTSKSSLSSNEDEARLPINMERPSNPIPWNGGRRSAWMGDADQDDSRTTSTNSISNSPNNDQIDPATTSQTTTPDPNDKLWIIEEPGEEENLLTGSGAVTQGGNTFSSMRTTDSPPKSDLESQRKFDRCIARIVELAMDGDVSFRDNLKDSEMVVLKNKVNRAYQMLESLTEHNTVQLPGVFKVLLRSCLSHQAVDHALNIYNKSLKCGVVVDEISFQRLCDALEERGNLDLVFR